MNSVLSDLQEGRILQFEKNYLILHKAGFSYLSIEEKFSDFASLLDKMLQEPLLPDYFHIYSPPDLFIDFCRGQKRINIKVRNRIQLQYQHGAVLKLPQFNDVQFTSCQLTDRNVDALSSAHLDMYRKFWKSKTDFLKNGFGFAIFDKSNHIASVCYSASIANGVAEIDVATVDHYQRKGLASAAVSAFVKHSASYGITANWDCFEDNYASLNTAKSIGFTETGRYRFLSIFNNKTP